VISKDRSSRAIRGLRAPALVLAALAFAADLNLERSIVKKAVDRHIVAGIEESDLVLLEFSREETETLLRWEHAREFEYDGQMYDVVETWAVGDTVFYRCWWDREETALNSRMRLLALRALGDAPRVGDRGASLGSSSRLSSFVLPGDWAFPTPGPSDPRTPAPADRYLSIVIPPLTPPPRPA
jgi:hypothetical protein